MRRASHSTFVWLVDAVVAVAFFAMAVVELTHPVEEMHQRTSLSADLVQQAALCSLLVLRGHYPRAALVLMSLALLLPSVVTAHAVLFFGDFVPFLLVTYAVTRRAPEAWSRLAWLSGVVFWIGLVVRSGRYLDQVRNPLLPVLITAAVWAGARVVRRLAQQRVELEEALASLAAAQAIRRGQAVAGERARVAADMHDVVAHAVSLMVVQIGHARMALEG
jgi:signal transduction histidine kinase